MDQAAVSLVPLSCTRLRSNCLSAWSPWSPPLSGLTAGLIPAFKLPSWPLWAFRFVTPNLIQTWRFRDEETEVQRGPEACLESCGKWVAELGLKPMFSSVLLLPGLG